SWWPADRVDIERYGDIFRNNMDSDAFEAAWESGQGMELSKVFRCVEAIQ
ncbi:unnamed protein product, partial [marine sediment metagenome]